MIDVYAAIRPLLMRLDPETAHALTLAGLKAGLGPRATLRSEGLEANVFGLSFSNPLGLAAGFDKNAEVLQASFDMGFGFVEAGTVTLRQQKGNPRPRVFRDVRNQSVINRMGFPGLGIEPFLKNLMRFKSKHPKAIVGANIGINKDTPTPVEDYKACFLRLALVADYITVNVSSPNTAGLRQLQEKESLNALFAALMQARASLNKKTPLLLKVAPDLTPDQCRDIATAVLHHNIDGLIVSNTTVMRPPALAEKFQDEKGGLSGQLLTSLSTDRIRDFYTLTGGRVPIIGVGGIGSAEDAYAKIKAGATLLQLYTGLVFQGPDIIPRILEGLARLLAQDGYARIADAVGRDSGQSPLKAVV